MQCPNCTEDGVDEYITCEHRCSSFEVYWCPYCGAIAVGHNIDEPEPDDFMIPIYTRNKDE